jgi:hypothetical protein
MSAGLAHQPGNIFIPHSTNNFPPVQDVSLAGTFLQPRAAGWRKRSATAISHQNKEAPQNLPLHCTIAAESTL